MVRLGRRIYRTLRRTLTRPPLQTPDRESLDYIWNEISHERIYAHPHLNGHADPLDVVLDVGANVGAFTAWAAREYAPGLILCYEASPVTFEYLQRNLRRLERRYRRTRMTSVHAAVSDCDGRALCIYHRPGRIGASTLLEEGLARGGQPYPVQSTSLSRQLSIHGIDAVDLLKIDVEGHYMAVLAGIRDADFPRIRRIVLECDWVPEGAAPPSTVRDLLHSKGYDVELDDEDRANNVTVYATHRSVRH